MSSCEVTSWRHSVVILRDLVLLGVEYAGLYSIRVPLKSAVRSVKLKLEFPTPGRLVELVRPAGREYLNNIPADRHRLHSLTNSCHVVRLLPVSSGGASEKSARAQSGRDEEDNGSWMIVSRRCG